MLVDPGGAVRDEPARRGHAPTATLQRELDGLAWREGMPTPGGRDVPPGAGSGRVSEPDRRGRSGWSRAALRASRRSATRWTVGADGRGRAPRGAPPADAADRAPASGLRGRGARHRHGHAAVLGGPAPGRARVHARARSPADHRSRDRDQAERPVASPAGAARRSGAGAAPADPPPRLGARAAAVDQARPSSRARRDGVLFDGRARVRRFTMAVGPGFGVHVRTRDPARPVRDVFGRRSRSPVGRSSSTRTP